MASYLKFQWLVIHFFSQVDTLVNYGDTLFFVKEGRKQNFRKNGHWIRYSFSPMATTKRLLEHSDYDRGKMLTKTEFKNGKSKITKFDKREKPIEVSTYCGVQLSVYEKIINKKKKYVTIYNGLGNRTENEKIDFYRKN